MNTITIATWNVNSLRQRLQHTLDWTEQQSIDIALLQETKVEDQHFPRMELEEAGYNLAYTGQKTFNGVAILSKYPLQDVITKLPGDDQDDHCRYIEAVVNTPDSPIRVISVYVPNGQSPDSDKFDYKMRFFDRLYKRLEVLLSHDEPLIVGGDYNVAPEPIDVHDPKKWHGQVCFHPLEREHFRSLQWLGFTDAYRKLHPNENKFSWWDYRMKQFERNEGLRIDHLLLSARTVDYLTEADIDDTPRSWEKPSDHTPVWCKLAG